MFELEHEIEAWRQEMHAAELTAEVLLELEEHLREDFARAVNSGVAPADAFAAARRRIGPPTVLKQEFNLIAPPGVLGLLRRHASKLMLCSAIGLTAAILLPVLRPPSFRSDATLFFRIITPDGRADVPDVRMAIQGTMHEQLELFTSDQLLRRVVEKPGAARILRPFGGGDDIERATAAIRNGLTVQVPANSHTVRLAYRHPDRELAQKVAATIIDESLRLNVEIFRARGERLAVAGISNISLVKAPTAPFADFAPLYWIQATLLGAGLFAGVLWVAIVGVSNRASVRAA